MKSKKLLVLKGTAGLGNRFITLMKAINYAKLSHRALYVDWGDGMFGAKGENIFYDYFQLKNIDTVDSLDDVLELYRSRASTYPKGLTEDDLRYPVYTERSAKGLYFVYNPKVSFFVPYKVGLSVIPLHKLVYLFGLQSFQRVENEKGMTWVKVVRGMFNGDNFPLGGNLWPWLKEDIVLFADFRPMVSMRHFFEYCDIKPEFRKKVKMIADEMDLNNAIGVHVRYTDKKPKAKLDKIIDVIRKKLDADCSLRVYICSDNEDINHQFKNEFGNKVIYREKFLPKVDDGGIHIWAAQQQDGCLKRQMFEDCLLDMWLLSKCKVLYWQGNSSFSYISKLLRSDAQETCDWMKL